MDIQQIQEVKERFKEHLKGKDWVRGVGIDADLSGIMGLRLNVDKDTAPAEIESTFEGIHVNVVRMGKIEPRS